MNQQWLEQQTEELGLALARQGIRLAVPIDDTARTTGESSVDLGRLAAYIDHTLLNPPTASKAEIRGLCQEARRYGFASVCVNPVHVRLAARLLAGCPVKTCTVIGFPLGGGYHFRQSGGSAGCGGQRCR